MLTRVILFFLIVLAAAVLGLGMIVGIAAVIAKALLVLFLVLLCVSFFRRRRS